MKKNYHSVILRSVATKTLILLIHTYGPDAVALPMLIRISILSIHLGLRYRLFPLDLRSLRWKKAGLVLACPGLL